MSKRARSRTARAVLVLSLAGRGFACSSTSQPTAQDIAGAAGSVSGAGGQAGHGAGAGSSAGNAGGAAGSVVGGSAGVIGAIGGGAGGASAGMGGASLGGAGSSGGAGAGAGAGGAHSGGAAGGGAAGSGAAGAAALDVTFFVVADTHADPPPSSDLQPMARAVNAVAKNGTWPTQIAGQDTHFKGGAIGKPRGVVFVGDMTGWGTAPTELVTFRHYFEAGNSADSIAYPGYLGLGNHDIDSADRPEPLASQYRALEWGYVDARHKGPNAPVPVTNYDAASHDYSFDFAGVHLFQGHRFTNDVQYGLPTGSAFLAADLKKYASDGRPVILFQHYGMDAFGTQERWWTDADRAAYRTTLKGYHVSAIIVGHTHAAFNYDWQGLRVFQVNNAKAEINAGNNDGNGSFAIVRITAKQIDIVTCRWLDDSGKYELIGPYLSGPADPGAAQ